MRNLTVEEKNTIFKTLATLNIIYLSLVTNVPTDISTNQPKYENDLSRMKTNQKLLYVKNMKMVA